MCLQSVVLQLFYIYVYNRPMLFIQLGHVSEICTHFPTAHNVPVLPSLTHLAMKHPWNALDQRLPQHVKANNTPYYTAAVQNNNPQATVRQNVCICMKI